MTHDTLTVLLAESADLQQWRQQVREFVRTHLPPQLARKVSLGLDLGKADYVEWQQILYRNGWFAGAWPLEHGGQGWGLLKQWVFTQESTLCGAPMVIPYGVNMLGPVLYTFGTERQRREHLPGILRSEVWWCQGYSEPGAGSDLASLQTTAVREGDYYVVNGTKMWTTQAQWADWMHCLVRTDRDVKPQRGISFLLIDMSSPGLEVVPITTIDGQHHTNQVFLDNVRVPVANRIGSEGQGWAIAKFLLGNERTSIADTGPKLRLFRRIETQYSSQVAYGTLTATQRAAWEAKLAAAGIQLLTLCALERRYVEAWARGEPPGVGASILKIRGTEILQRLTEIAMELGGPFTPAHDPVDLHHDTSTEPEARQWASRMSHEYLYGRCWSIFGGTNEIQRNLIAREVLASAANAK